MIAFVVWVLFAAPNPPPPPTVRYADVALRYQRGEVSVTGIKLGRFDKPTAIARFRGRFEARALRGKNILDRVAFDFPLTAEAETDDTDDKGRLVADRLRRGVTAQATVRVPLPDGAETLEIYDPVTQKSVTAPLKETPAAPAGAPRAP